MANSNAFSAVPELDVEEKLLNALTYGPLEQNEGLLDSLEDVDVRTLDQRTLLHVGVNLGKLDWVEELLGRGADPNLEDASHSTAMSSAEEMFLRFPEDSDHRQVRRLVRMVQRRDQAMRRRLETTAARNAASSSPPVFLSGHLSAMDDLSSSANALKDEMRSLTTELSSSLEELKEKFCRREEVMQCWDEVVTSSIEDLTSLSDCLARETTLETPLPASIMADERSECVDGMLRRTVHVCGGEEGVRSMRKLYERLYDEDVVTKCLLQFLYREPYFVAKVDCDSERIERMKTGYVEFDGKTWSGSYWGSCADLSTNTVYLGAKVDVDGTEVYVAMMFAWALAQMSIHLAFDNGGKPYECGDSEHETEFKRALEEAEMRKREDRLHPGIRRAFVWDTQTARESCLAACVPEIIAFHGSEEGTRVLGDQAPRLLHYFKEHVVATLLDMAGE